MSIIRPLERYVAANELAIKNKLSYAWKARRCNSRLDHVKIVKSGMGYAPWVWKCAAFFASR